MTHDAKCLMVYGVTRKQRDALQRFAKRKKKKSVSEMVRDEYINPIMKKMGIKIP